MLLVYNVYNPLLRHPPVKDYDEPWCTYLTRVVCLLVLYALEMHKEYGQHLRAFFDHVVVLEGVLGRNAAVDVLKHFFWVSSQPMFCLRKTNI